VDRFYDGIAITRVISDKEVTCVLYWVVSSVCLGLYGSVNCIYRAINSVWWTILKVVCNVKSIAMVVGVTVKIGNVLSVHVRFL
jgi:hypothetical protein